MRNFSFAPFLEESQSSNICLSSELNFSDEIIGQSRHQFIYGENGKRREEILKGIVNDNPIVCDVNEPGSIYLGDDYLSGGESVCACVCGNESK